MTSTVVTTGDLLQNIVGLFVYLTQITIRIIVIIFAVWKAIAPILALVLVLGIIYIARRGWQEEQKIRNLYSRDLFGLEIVSKRQTHKAWEVIQNRLKSRDPKQYKLAVIGADDLLDDTLISLGYKAETFEEALNLVEPDKISRPEDILKAHEIIDGLFEDETAQITQEGAQKIVKVYEKTLKELGILGKQAEAITDIKIEEEKK